MTLPYANARRSRSANRGTLIMLLLAACSTEPRIAAHAPRKIFVESGDQQDGIATAPLRESLVIRVTDLDGAPIVGADVLWTTPDGGTFSPATTQSDARGVARTMWTLGESGA